MINVVVPSKEFTNPEVWNGWEADCGSKSDLVLVDPSTNFVSKDRGGGLED